MAPPSPRAVLSTVAGRIYGAESRAGVGGQPVRSLFTPFDARADIILGTDCGRHGGRLKNPRT